MLHFSVLLSLIASISLAFLSIVALSEMQHFSLSLMLSVMETDYFDALRAGAL
jgi:hypothetical protein